MNDSTRRGLRGEESEAGLLSQFKKVNRVFKRGQFVFQSKDNAALVELPLGEEIFALDLTLPCPLSSSKDRRFVILSPRQDEFSHILLAFTSVSEAEKFAAKFGSLLTSSI